ncbi:ATP-binding cassette domain-containing protein [Bifidobacterium panos]|uniref:ABC transporter ATP-binding protein n=1 Tax=Bifidobacterium panos TaxID=2675321 RepID=A0ABX1SX44_9BIFI|nr:ATP-binding cassette domain-containing protein [Bifidobacterium sp. DSM 109963]NMN02405.1 ABC transporter ATP-binding protein [Bifidobacterium sp. DSM 109963]
MSEKDDKDLKDNDVKDLTDELTDGAEEATHAESVENGENGDAEHDATPQSVSFDIVFDDEEPDEHSDNGSDAADNDGSDAASDFFSAPLMGDESDDTDSTDDTDDDTAVPEETSASATAANARRVNETIALGGDALKRKATVDPNEGKPAASVADARLDAQVSDQVLLKSYPTFSLNHVTTTDHKSGRHVLDDTSMAFYAGSLYAVKVLDDEEDAEQRATLMAVLTGFQPPASGAVMTKSSNITELEVGDLRGHRLGVVTQRYAVRTDLDAETNVLYAMNGSGRTFLKPKPVIARELLNRVGFGEATKGSKVGDLPLLEQRRVAIARALSCEAETLILDEPTKGLGEEDAATLLKLLESIAHGRNPKRAVIIVTSSDEVASAAEQTYEL